MQLAQHSHVNILCLQGSILTNEHGTDFYIDNISLSLDELMPYLHLVKVDDLTEWGAICFDRLEGWSLQLTPKAAVDPGDL